MGKHELRLVYEIKQLLPKELVDCAESNAAEKIQNILKGLDFATKLEMFRILTTDEKSKLARMSDNLYNDVKYYRNILAQKARTRYALPKTVAEFRRLHDIVGGQDLSVGYPPEAEVMCVFSSHPDHGDIVAVLLKRWDFEQGADIGFLLKEKLHCVRNKKT